MRLIVCLIVLGLAACSTPRVQTKKAFDIDDLSAAEIADVKTCGCPVKAPCGDCCGPEHCRCSPNGTQ